MHRLRIAFFLFFTAPHAAASSHGVVVSDCAIASEVGASTLQRGGNAVDAAVAVALALAVVRPEAGNLGGGGFMLIQPASGPANFIDFRETAPRAATSSLLLDDDGNYDPDRALWSGRAVGVPGTVAGLALALERFGSLEWGDLVEPARQLAKAGFLVNDRLAALFDLHRQRLARHPETRRIFLRGGLSPYREGERFAQPELAETLALLGSHGPRAFYQGAIAERLIDTVQRTGGIIDAVDLARYTARERQPLTGTFLGRTVVTVGPPSSGGGVLLLMLNMVEALVSEPRLPKTWPAPIDHVLLEIMRRAYAVRSTEFGDPDFVAMDLNTVLSREFATRLVASIGPRATPSAQVTLPLADWQPHPTSPEGSSTTHFAVVDLAGNAVATTTTLNASFGSGITVDGAGFLLNNEMDDFTAKRGTANLYGLVQGKRNTIEPGKRPLSSMTPVITLNEAGVPALVLGSPGGSRITTAVFQALLNTALFGMDPDAAVAAQRVHHQFLPDHVMYEPGALNARVRADLKKRGHVIADEPRVVGHVHLAEQRPDGSWIAIADERRGGAVATPNNR